MRQLDSVMMTGAIRAITATCLIWTLGGCVPPAFLSRPNLGQQLPQLKKIVLLPPRVDVFEIGAGGVLEKIDGWSQAGAENILRAFAADLGQRQGLQVSRVDAAKLPEATKYELEQTQLLFDAVTASVVPHVYGVPAQRFEDKITNFDYSLGADTAKLNLGDADVFIIAKGVDQVSSAGRQALQVTTMLAAAAVGVIILPRGGVTAINVALVDAHNGDILWYAMSRSEGGYDLRDSSSAAAFVKNSLSGFPIQGP